MTDLLTRLEAKTKYAGLLAFAKDNSRGFGKRALLANELIALYSENERLRLALVEAVKQRSHGYRYVWDALSDKQKSEIGQWFERDDAALLAIIDGEVKT